MTMTFDMITLAKLLLAAVLGGMIGFEREIHGRPAGFRTHLLVSLGACLFVITSIQFYTHYGNFSGIQPVGVDPGRVAAQVVTGIGFLGAGAIIREKFSVRGLTTAACLWLAAAIGVACGVGLFGIAITVTLISLASLLFLKSVEKRINRDTYVFLRVWSEDLPQQIEKIESRLAGCEVQSQHLRIEKNITTAELHLVYQIKYNAKSLSADPVHTLASLAGIKRVAMGLE
jgi:putative Mg2+ transporter-C (MgtC) family protein